MKVASRRIFGPCAKNAALTRTKSGIFGEMDVKVESKMAFEAARSAMHANTLPGLPQS
jgi:hypothetical protein